MKRPCVFRGMLLVVAVLGLMAGGAQAAPIAYVDIALTDGGGHAVDIDHVGQVIQVDLVLYIRNLNTATNKKEFFIDTIGNVVSTGALKGGMMFDPDDTRSVGTAVGSWVNSNYIDPATGESYTTDRINLDPSMLSVGRRVGGVVSPYDVDGDGDVDIGDKATSDTQYLQAWANNTSAGVSTSDGNVTLGGTVYAKFFLARGLEFTVDAQMLSIGESTVIQYAPRTGGSTTAQVKSDYATAADFYNLTDASIPTNLGIGNGTFSGVTVTSIIPEPATMVLLGLGGSVVAIRRRRVA